MRLSINIACAPLCIAIPPVVTDYAAALDPPAHIAATTASNQQADENYSNGMQAINQSQWSRAESEFSKVVDAHGLRADGALYWKAYALLKQGRGADALASCSQLEHTFPQSRWREECGALKIEVRGTSDHPVQPQSEQDPDLKLLALSSQMRSNEAEAVPLVQQILVGNGSAKIKQRALFVLAQGKSQQAQDLMAAIAHGKIAPGLQGSAIHILGTRQNLQTDRELNEIYLESNDVHIKDAVLQSYLVRGNRDLLVKIANTETNPLLIRTATRALGVMGDSDDLLALYRRSDKTSLKAMVIDAFVAGGEEQTLFTIIDSEKDPVLHQNAIRALGRFQDQSTGSKLVDIYRNSLDDRSRHAAIDALFALGDSAHLESLEQLEHNPALLSDIRRRLDLLHGRQ